MKGCCADASLTQVCIRVHKHNLCMQSFSSLLMHTDAQAYASQVVMSWGGLAEQLVPVNVGQQTQLAYHSMLQVHTPCLFM